MVEFMRHGCDQKKRVFELCASYRNPALFTCPLLRGFTYRMVHTYPSGMSAAIVTPIWKNLAQLVSLVSEDFHLDAVAIYLHIGAYAREKHFCGRWSFIVRVGKILRGVQRNLCL